MVVATPGQQRRDARLNREAILDAARELFAESADVPMCRVARRAGVGQATLYRNFHDRGALAAELLDEHLERIADLAAAHRGEPDAFFVLLRSLVERKAHLHVLAELARDVADSDSRLERNRSRIAALIEEPMRDAKAAGRLRGDLSLDDFFLLLRTARCAMEGAADAAARAEAADRLLDLMRDGLVPSHSPAG